MCARSDITEPTTSKTITHQKLIPQPLILCAFLYLKAEHHSVQGRTLWKSMQMRRHTWKFV
jgi:hypothetical protein